jgi:hypothetical protein
MDFARPVRSSILEQLALAQDYKGQLMASDLTVETDSMPLMNPRPFLLAGMAGMVCAVLAAPLLNGGTWMWIVPSVLFASGVAVGSAVALRARNAVIVGLAGLAALIGSYGFVTINWDSAVLLYRVLAAIAAAGAILVALPGVWRRLAATGMILFHFGGILVAVTSVPPNTVWLSNYAWCYLYHPYLQFLYFNNAYHFYAPEPGPAFLLWFLVEYEKDADGRHWRWVKVPELDHDGNYLRPQGGRLWPKVEYTRRLSLANYAGMPGTQPGNLEALMRRRLAAGQLREVPIHPTIPINNQHHYPAPMSRLYLRDYVRHVASTYKCPKNPELQVRNVKVYYVIHQLIGPGMMAQGERPDDPAQYLPVYMGEFDAHGNFTDYLDADQPTGAGDPFLYWLIPIVKDQGGHVTNYVLKHANVPDEGLIP